MAVHPIEERYGTTEMRAVWSEKTRFSCIVAVKLRWQRPKRHTA